MGNFSYKYKNDPALIGSSMITAAVILNLLTPLWIESIHALIKTKTEIDVAALLLYAFGCAISFLRYKREKGRIIKEFKESKYNKLIPNWIFPLFMPLSIVIGIFFDYFARRLLGI